MKEQIRARVVGEVTREFGNKNPRLILSKTVLPIPPELLQDPLTPVSEFKKYNFSKTPLNGDDTAIPLTESESTDVQRALDCLKTLRLNGSQLNHPEEDPDEIVQLCDVRVLLMDFFYESPYDGLGQNEFGGLLKKLFRDLPEYPTKTDKQPSNQ